MISFLGFSFFSYMVSENILFCFLQTEALPPANEKSFLWIFKRAPCRRHFWAFGLSFKEHCFHQFESNLKTRHYKYALIFKGDFINSFVSMFSFVIFKSYLFSKKSVCFISWKQWLIIEKSFDFLPMFLHYVILLFLLFYFYVCFSFCFMVHYFRRISLNSMAGLEFRGNKENTKTNNQKEINAKHIKQHKT